MKPNYVITVLSIIFFASIGGASGEHTGGHGSADASGRAGNPDNVTRTVSIEMTDGEVRKVDRNNNKVTIKHGEIRNLDMPGMTMVFQVKHPGLLDKVQVGDKVKFRAEKSGSAFVVTDIQPEK
jgi:Cu(I)/Ag(I) efflux system periplasmic protein CusF